jgi:outer membrane protein TolC
VRAPAASDRSIEGRLEFDQPRHGVGERTKTRLGTDGDRDARGCEHGRVERVVAERGIEHLAGLDVFAQVRDLAQGVGDRPFDVGDDHVALVSRPRRDHPVRLEADQRAGFDDDGDRRRADEPGAHSRGADLLEDAEQFSVAPLREAGAPDDVARERAELVAPPTGEAPRHHLAHAFFGKKAFQVRRVDPARDVRTPSGIGQAVGARIAPESLERGWLHATRFDERMKQIFPDVALPQRPVAVRGDDAAGLRAHQCLDARPHGVGGLQLHAIIISDRLETGLPLGCAANVERTGQSMRSVVGAGAFAILAGMSMGWGSDALAQETRAPGPPSAPAPAVSPSPATPPPVAPATAGAPGATDDTSPMPVPDDLTKAQPGGVTADQVFVRAAETSWSAKASEAALRAAAARVDEAWAAFLPRLSGIAKYTRLSGFTPPNLGTIVSTNIVPPAGQKPPVLNTGDALTLPPGPNGMPAQLYATALAFPIVKDNWLFQGTITVPISDYFLSIDQKYSAATRSREAARWDLASARAVAGSNGRVAYFTWLRARGAVIVAVQAINDQRTHLRDARNQFAVGNASKADELRAETAVSSAELSLVQAQNLASLSEKQVRVALHIPDDVALAPGEDLDAALPPQQGNLEQLIGEAMSARPEVKSADLNAEAAQKQASAAAAARYPNLSAFADGIVGNPNPRVFPPTNAWFPTWDLGAQLTWSPNDVLVANGAVNDAEAQAASIMANKETTRDGIQIEVTQYWQNVRESDFAIEASAHELASAEEAYRVARELFTNGRGTSTTLTDAETDLTRARLDRLNAKADARIARVQLEHALGRDVK